VLAAAICAALVAAGRRVAAFKPVVTGLDDPAGVWPRDHELLAQITGQEPSAVTPLTFGPATSPHYAAELAGHEIDGPGLAAAALAAGAGAEVLVAEGVGGLNVPLSGSYLVRDLAAALGLPVVVAARPGLGTINHTLLTLQAARAAGLEVAAVVMTPWPSDPSGMELSNRLTVARLGQVEVVGLRAVAPDAADLAAAAGRLPLEEWLGS
jgi:dethiobiotin synthetase